MEPYRVPQSSRGNAWGFHGITQNSIKVQRIPGNSMKFHGIPEFHGVILQGYVILRYVLLECVFLQYGVWSMEYVIPAFGSCAFAVCAFALSAFAVCAFT